MALVMTHGRRARADRPDAKNPEGVLAETSTLSGFSTLLGLQPRKAGLPEGPGVTSRSLRVRFGVAPVPTNGKVGLPSPTCKPGGFPFFATQDSISRPQQFSLLSGLTRSRARENEPATSGTSKGWRVSPRHGVGFGQHPKRNAGWENCDRKGGHSRDINNALRWRHWPCFRL